MLEREFKRGSMKLQSHVGTTWCRSLGSYNRWVSNQSLRVGFLVSCVAMVCNKSLRDGVVCYEVTIACRNDQSLRGGFFQTAARRCSSLGSYNR